MKYNSFVKKGSVDKSPGRVLLVEDNEKTVQCLRDLWDYLGLADSLEVFSDVEHAFRILQNDAAGQHPSPVIAIILASETAEEKPTECLHKIRSTGPCKDVPALLWTRDKQSCQRLPGTEVQCVVKKPKLLSLINELNTLCELHVYR